MLSANRRPYFVNSRCLAHYDGPRLWQDAITDLKMQAPKQVFDESADPSQAQAHGGDAARTTGATSTGGTTPAGDIPVAAPCIFDAASSGGAGAADQMDLEGYLCSLDINAADAALYTTKLKEDGFDVVSDLKDMSEEDLKEIGMKKGHMRKVIKAAQTCS